MMNLFMQDQPNNSSGSQRIPACARDFSCDRSTVEPRHTTTPLIRPPRYYDQRPPFGVPSLYFLYKITPLIRPVKMPGETAEFKK